MAQKPCEIEPAIVIVISTGWLCPVNQRKSGDDLKKGNAQRLAAPQSTKNPPDTPAGSFIFLVPEQLDLLQFFGQRLVLQPGPHGAGE
jgi:hypothetical protein